jgi:hypothetical protein
MRQVLLAAPARRGRQSSLPVILWMDDHTRLGDSFSWLGVEWKVSAVYGTRLGGGGPASRRDRPRRTVDGGDSGGIDLD